MASSMASSIVRLLYKRENLRRVPCVILHATFYMHRVGARNGGTQPRAKTLTPWNGRQSETHIILVLLRIVLLTLRK